MNVLVPNLGSTSLKYRLIDMPSGRTLASGRFERVSDYRQAIARIPLDEHRVDAVVFKAVHGGETYRCTARIGQDVLDALERFLTAAPAHNAIYLAGIRAFQDALPGVPLVAAFETEFHATMPEYAAVYGTPESWRTDGVRRYGFHGASHQYVSERVPEILGLRTAEGQRLVSCHLGGSASICAILDGRSIDTTMGFSPQSGLENATRHGDLDPFAVFHMMAIHGWTAEEAARQLAQSGGLAGISGIPGGDVRDLEQAAGAGDSRARLALDAFAYQVRKTIGAYAAAMGGVDAVAFTGGIGENSANLREACLRDLRFLGLELDPAANRTGTGDRIVSAPGSAAAVVVLGTDEESVVARRAYRLLTA